MQKYGRHRLPLNSVVHVKSLKVRLRRQKPNNEPQLNGWICCQSSFLKISVPLSFIPCIILCYLPQRLEAKNQLELTQVTREWQFIQMAKITGGICAGEWPSCVIPCVMAADRTATGGESVWDCDPSFWQRSEWVFLPQHMLLQFGHCHSRNMKTNYMKKHQKGGNRKVSSKITYNKVFSGCKLHLLQ